MDIDEKKLEEYRRRKRKRQQQKKLRQQRERLLIISCVGILIVILTILGMRSCRESEEQKKAGAAAKQKVESQETKVLADDETQIQKPDMVVDLLTRNPYSRPAIKGNNITGIVIHYTANPGTTAKQNRSYFESLKDTHDTKASSHFVVGLEGEIVQCIPTAEISYASNDRNWDTVSIECCHPGKDGKFNEPTYETCVKLTAWLCDKFGLTEKDVIRHYDVTGKECPKYFVDNKSEWKKFRQDVKKILDTRKKK